MKKAELVNRIAGVESRLLAVEYHLSGEVRRAMDRIACLEKQLAAKTKKAKK
jgi:hypothetical protein